MSSPMQKRVLVVEDEAPMREVVADILVAEGLTVVCAGTGTQALQHLQTETFDLVVLDVGLPDMNGLDILARLPKGPEAPRVVVVTGDQTHATLLRAVREQAYSYLTKPYPAETLLKVVRDALAAPAEPPIEVLSAKPEWVELLVPCSRDAAERIQSFMLQLRADLSDEVRESVGYAFHELLLNAVEWGGGLDPQRRVRIAYLRTRRMLQYRIADPGPGFHFDGLKHAALSNPPEDPVHHLQARAAKGLRPGGLGILMVRALADELLYNEAQNEVMFVKYLD